MTVTISGPGCDEKRDDPQVGLSLAITRASEASRRREESTFYVRNLDGNVVGQAESFADGSVSVYGTMPLVEVTP
jgi:hypothetical protein